jgi:hypothetical protein
MIPPALHIHRKCEEYRYPWLTRAADHVRQLMQDTKGNEISVPGAIAENCNERFPSWMGFRKGNAPLLTDNPELT